MGWAYGLIDGKEVGYSVAATCEQEGCDATIDRGLAYRCGGMPDEGCNGYFCQRHLYIQVGRRGAWCETCIDPPTCEACGEELEDRLDFGEEVLFCADEDCDRFDLPARTASTS